MDKKHRNISKYLSFLLRHQPRAIGLQVNAHGWAEIDELIGKARKDGRALDRSTILKVVHESDKTRFEISDDEQKIRATYGHSIPVNLDYQAEKPPKTLYHGTATHNLDSIRQQGLVAGNRLYVHLSVDTDTATEVGSRHGQPVLLSIRAEEMHHHGYDFYPTPSAIWLSSHVPYQYIDEKDSA